MPNVGADLYTGGFYNMFGGDRAGAAEFGRRITVPELTSLADILKGGTAANVAALPGIKAFAGDVNRFNQSEITRMLESTTPGLLGGLRTATGTAASLARGEIPEDVGRAIQSSSAARAAGGGFSGSGLGRNLTARDLGLTSLNLTGEGQQRLMGLGAFSRNLFPSFDFSTAFLNSNQMLDYAYSKFQRDLLSEEAAAAPDPVARGNFDMEMAIGGMLMGAYSGGAGYAGQFRQGYSGGKEDAAAARRLEKSGGGWMGYGGGGWAAPPSRGTSGGYDYNAPNPAASQDWGSMWG